MMDRSVQFQGFIIGIQIAVVHCALRLNFSTIAASSDISANPFSITNVQT
jgi:hypothetical protein